MTANGNDSNTQGNLETATTTHEVRKDETVDTNHIQNENPEVVVNEPETATSAEVVTETVTTGAPAEVAAETETTGAPAEVVAETTTEAKSENKPAHHGKGKRFGKHGKKGKFQKPNKPAKPEIDPAVKEELIAAFDSRTPIKVKVGDVSLNKKVNPPTPSGNSTFYKDVRLFLPGTELPKSVNQVELVGTEDFEVLVVSDPRKGSLVVSRKQLLADQYAARVAARGERERVRSEFVKGLNERTEAGETIVVQFTVADTTELTNKETGKTYACCYVDVEGWPLQGFLHGSQVPLENGAPKVFTKGETGEARVSRVDVEKARVSLSMRAPRSENPQPRRDERQGNGRRNNNNRNNGGKSFGGNRNSGQPNGQRRDGGATPRPAADAAPKADPEPARVVYSTEQVTAPSAASTASAPSKKAKDAARKHAPAPKSNRRSERTFGSFEELAAAFTPATEAAAPEETAPETTGEGAVKPTDESAA